MMRRKEDLRDWSVGSELVWLFVCCSAEKLVHKPMLLVTFRSSSLSFKRELCECKCSIGRKEGQSTALRIALHTLVRLPVLPWRDNFFFPCLYWSFRWWRASLPCIAISQSIVNAFLFCSYTWQEEGLIWIRFKQTFSSRKEERISSTRKESPSLPCIFSLDFIIADSLIEELNIDFIKAETCVYKCRWVYTTLFWLRMNTRSSWALPLNFLWTPVEKWWFRDSASFASVTGILWQEQQANYYTSCS